MRPLRGGQAPRGGFGGEAAPERPADRLALGSTRLAHDARDCAAVDERAGGAEERDSSEYGCGVGHAGAQSRGAGRSLRLEHAAAGAAFTHRNLEFREALGAAAGVAESVGRLGRPAVGRAAAEPDHQERLAGAGARWRGSGRGARLRRAQAVDVDDVARVGHGGFVGSGGGRT